LVDGDAVINRRSVLGDQDRRTGIGLPLLDLDEITGAVQEDGVAIDDEFLDNLPRSRVGTQEFSWLTRRGQKLRLKLRASPAKQDELLVRTDPNVFDIDE